VIPLGGLGEVGKNVMVVDSVDDGFVVIDCGITFPREEGVFGVDIVLPDFSWIIENADRLRAVILTHAHEDHIGALPYLMREINVPEVWGTRFTLALVKAKADEFGVVTQTSWCEVTPSTDEVRVGPFDVEFVRMSHSIPDCTAVAIHTDHGTLFHTGDFKLDPSPVDGVRTDLSHIADIGAGGVSLYMGDSTNADVPGHTRSERSINGSLRDIVAGAPGRVIAACFSSHIHRIQQFCDIAGETGRAVCIMGRSMVRNTNIARSLGYFDVTGVRVIKPAGLEELDPRETLILCTGSQGEALAAMNRIAWGTHPSIQPDPLDTIIFSSRTIPGNETRVHGIINQLSKVGARILHDTIAPVHVSGHASSEELKTMLQLVRPDHVMPVHGEWRHLRAHADLARMVGIDESRVILNDNGGVIELRDGVATATGEWVTVGQRLIDRHNSEDILERVLEDRQQASGDGLLVVVAHETSGTLEVISRGFVQDDDEVLGEVRRAAEESLEQAAGTHSAPGEIEHEMQEAVSAAVFEATRRSPLVVPVVLGD
jgi:ribonuclease J